LFGELSGLFELTSQWFVSCRAIDRLGVFVAAMLLPDRCQSLGLLMLTGSFDLVIGLIRQVTFALPELIYWAICRSDLTRFIDELTALHLNRWY
jgi:hypothetical protein